MIDNNKDIIDAACEKYGVIIKFMGRQNLHFNKYLLVDDNNYEFYLFNENNETCNKEITEQAILYYIDNNKKG